MAKKPIAKSPVRKVSKKAPPKPAAKARPAPSATRVADKKAVTKKAAKPAATDAESGSREKRAAASERVIPVSVPPEVELGNVDEQLVALLNKRASLYLQKMKGVETPSKIVFSDLDQQQVWGMIDRCNEGPLTSAEIKTIFRPLIECRTPADQEHSRGLSGASLQLHTSGGDHKIW